MPILYSLISRGVHVLCDWTAAGVEGNFSLVSRLLLRKLQPDGPTRCSYLYNHCVFHYITHASFVYLCMTDGAFPSEPAFAYLAALQSTFLSQHAADCQTVVAYSYQVIFQPAFDSLAQHYNTPPLSHHHHSTTPSTPSHTHPAQQQPSTVQHVMVANLERILERGERIELLVQKASTMEEPAVRLVLDRDEGRTRRKQKVQRGTCRIAAVLAVFLGAVLYVSLTMACGGPKLPKCTP